MTQTPLLHSRSWQTRRSTSSVSSRCQSREQYPAFRDHQKFLHVKDAYLKSKRIQTLTFLAAGEALANWVLHYQSKPVMLSGYLIKT
uniref:Uncharacterized protein n=1 Tax=Hyaloperonospora arabidopsidis (strain Emoy2) TaxID=559515 RepID=M4B919_HYAAE